MHTLGYMKISDAFPFILSAGEPQILDYVTQQHKLFIAIASSHAFSLTAKWLTRMYQNVTAELEKGNMDELPEVSLVN